MTFPLAEIKTVVLYGADNEVDLVVLEVLIRKARTIRRQLGVAVPVPAGSDQVVEAVVDTVLLRGQGRAGQLRLAFTDPEVSRLHSEWESAAAKEGKQRTFFGQHGIQPDEVAREIDATDPVLGDAATVQRFLLSAAQRFDGELRPGAREGIFELDPGDLRDTLRALEPGAGGRRSGGSWNGRATLPVTFDPVEADGAVYLSRTHPIVAAYCDAVLGGALGPEPDPRFARCGAIYTDRVSVRTAVLLLRLRYGLRERSDELAEEVMLAAFQRREGQPAWLEPVESAGRELFEGARPAAPMSAGERSGHVGWALDLLGRTPGWYRPILEQRVGQLEESNARLRKLVRERQRLRIIPHEPPDILGCWVLVPGGRS